MNSEQPWNICDDFLDPLAELMLLSDVDNFFWEINPEAMKSYPDSMIYAEELRKAIITGNAAVAIAWLEVNVSVALADRIREKITKAIHKVETSKDSLDLDVSATGRYLQGVTLAIREKQGRPISKSDIPKTEKKTSPMTKADLADVFMCGKNDVNEKVLKKYEHWTEGGGKRLKYRMRVCDMPPEYRGVINSRREKKK